MHTGKHTMGAAAFLCSLLTLESLPAAGQQTPAPGMIRIDACRVARAPKTDRAAPFGALTIAYANTGELPLGRVDFSVTYGGVTQTVADTGYFSHNSEIWHRFDAFGRYPIAAAEPACQVTAVRLATPRHGAIRRARTRTHTRAAAQSHQRRRHHFLFFSWWS